MRKYLLLFAIFLISLSSCFLSSESIEFEALCTQGIYSTFGYPGFYYDGVNIMERDESGRILFEFYGTNTSAFSVDHLMICQYIDYDKEYVYYYPINNLLISENSEYFEEDIEQLKLNNDWDKDIDLSKCIRKKIDRYKSTTWPSYVQEIFDKHNPIEYKCYYKIFLCDRDKNGLELYAGKAWGEMDPINGIYAILVDSNNPSSYTIEEVKDKNYINQINSLKKKNNWVYDYYIEK